MSLMLLTLLACLDPDAIPYEEHLEMVGEVDSSGLPDGFGRCGAFTEVAQQTVFVNLVGEEVVYELIAEECAVHHSATLSVDGEDTVLAARGLVLRVRTTAEPPEWLFEEIIRDFTTDEDNRRTYEIGGAR